MDKGLRFVIVDDNADFLFTMATFLQRNGFEVYTADDGQSGLEMIRKEHLPRRLRGLVCGSI